MATKSSKSIGPYPVIGKPLGSGGMATVYRVENEKGKECALKVMHPHLNSERKIVDRFKQEFEIGQRMRSNSAFVDMYSCEKRDGQWCILMEFVPGETLEKKLYEPAEACAVIQAVAKALVPFHAEGLLHRDLKPDNIMLTPKGTMKIMDYGVTRDIANRMTRTGTTVGTPLYMAPEQLAAEKKLSPGVDIFSLGCILYRLCTRKDIHGLPYTVELIKIATSRHQDDIRKLPGLDEPELQDFIQRSVWPDPSKRIQSIQQFLSEMEALPCVNRKTASLLKKLPGKKAKPSKSKAANNSVAKTIVDKPVAKKKSTSKKPSRKEPPAGKFPIKLLFMLIAVMLLIGAALIFFFGGEELRNSIKKMF